MRAPVSVIIPCYRCADTIARAVESVMAQTLPPEEILLVDDCSADAGKTLAALTHVQQRFAGAPITILPLAKNGGPGDARNAGWEAASQPYIAFLDADDSWHSQKLEIQYSWMADHPEAVLTGHRSLCLETRTPRHELPTRYRVMRMGRALLLSNRIPTRSVMLRRDVPQRFEAGKRHAEDYLLWLRIVLGGHPAFLLDMPLAYAHKAEFGAGGLTQQLWKMEAGELDTYRRICREGLISAVTYAGLAVFSLMKFLRRLAIAGFRRFRSPGG